MPLACHWDAQDIVNWRRTGVSWVELGKAMQRAQHINATREPNRTVWEKARPFELPSAAAPGVECTRTSPLQQPRWILPEHPDAAAVEKKFIKTRVNADERRSMEAAKHPLDTSDTAFVALPVADLDLERETRITGKPVARRLGTESDPVGYVLCFKYTTVSLRRLQQMVAELHELGKQSKPRRMGKKTGATAIKITNTGTSAIATAATVAIGRFKTKDVPGKGAAYVDEILKMVGEEMDLVTSAIEEALHTDVLTRTRKAFHKIGLSRALLGRSAPWMSIGSSTGQRAQQHPDPFDASLCLLGVASEEPYLFGIGGLGYAIKLDAHHVVLFDARRHLHGIGVPPSDDAMGYSLYARSDHVTSVAALERKLQADAEEMNYVGADQQRAAARRMFPCVEGGGEIPTKRASKAAPPAAIPTAPPAMAPTALPTATPTAM